MTKTELQTLLAEYIAAEKSILKGQSVEIDGDRFTMADLDAVRRGRRDVESRLASYGRKRHSLAQF